MACRLCPKYLFNHVPAQPHTCPLREEPNPRHQGTLRGIAVLENGQGKAEHLATNKPRLGAPGGGAEHLPCEPEDPCEELQGP